MFKFKNKHKKVFDKETFQWQTCTCHALTNVIKDQVDFSEFSIRKGLGGVRRTKPKD